VRVAVADDAALFRAGLVLVLQKLGIEITCEAASGQELMALIRRDPPDLAVIDIAMNGRHEGIATAADVRRTFPDIGILVLSGHAVVAYAAELGSALGSRFGYLLKERVANAEALERDLRRILQGEVVIDPGIVARLIRRPSNRTLVDTLSPQEREVLAAMAEGRSNTGIAQQLRISRRTVEAHVTRVFSHFGLSESSVDDNRRVQAVLTFLRSQDDAPNRGLD
jgi:DNA-binding NarL/FixJ family response regulator